MVTDIWRYSFGERAVGLAAALAVALALGASAKPVFAADGTIAIDLTYDSTMDMSKPEVHPNISVHHNLQVRLSGGKLTENRDRSTGRFFDKNATVQEHGSADAGNVSWHVIDQKHLVRIQSFSQSVRKMTVTVNPDNTCRLDVTDELKPGFQEYAFLRVSVHSIGYFSSYRVVSTSCTIQ
jgi:hypothetical protein